MRTTFLRVLLPQVLLLTAVIAWPEVADAQKLALNHDGIPLHDAIFDLRTQAGIDIVFAARLIADHQSDCHYAGRDVEEALRCVLTSSGLQAEQVRRRQFVLVDPGGGGGSSDAGPRGTLAGFVIDSKSSEALPAAHVYLPDLGIGAVSNIAGYFAIPGLPAGLYRVRFSYVGYRTRDVVLTTDSVSVMVPLSAAALESARVLVEDTGDLPSDLRAVPSMVPVPASRLAQLPSFLGEQDLFQSLQWLPGVQKPGEVGGELIIRGGDSHQNLYLLDGVPVYHPWHTFSLFSTFQTETLKEVRLYKGSFPAEFGGRLSSVLDAQMKDGSRSDVRGSAGLSVISGRFMVEGPVNDKFSFMAAGRRSYLDLLFGRRRPLRSTDGTADTLRIGYYFFDVSTKLTYRISPHRTLSFSMYQGRDNLDVRIPFQSLLDADARAATGGLAFETAHRWGNQLLNLRYQFLASPRLFVTTTLYRSRYKGFEGTFVQPTTNASVSSDYDVRIRDMGVRVDADYYQSHSHHIRAGLHLVEHDFRSNLDALVWLSAGAADSLFQYSRLNALEGVAYVQSTWQPSRNWQFQPGLRLSGFSRGNYVHASPRLFVRYAALRDYLVVKGGVSTQVQYMHRLRDRYSFVYDIASSRWIPANKTVMPGTGIQLAGGFELVPAPWISLTADVYWRRFRNVLLPEDEYKSKDGLEGPGIETGTLLAQYVPGYGQSYGLELMSQLNFGRWHGWLSYAAGRAFQRGPLIRQQDYNPTRFDIPHNLQTALEWHTGRWTATLAAEIRSGFPLTIPTARFGAGDPLDDDDTLYLHRPTIHNGRLPTYIRFDLGLGYHFRFLKMGWNAELQIFNVTNRRNVVGRQYDPAMEVVKPVDRLGLPILPVLEIQVDW